MARYQSYNTGQQYFEIVNIEEELPEDNRARIIKEIVCNLDLSSFDNNYNNDNNGAKAKSLQMMLGVLFLSEMRGIRGSRTIVKVFPNDIEYKYIISGSKPPDASTIRKFKRRHVKELADLFSVIVHISSSMGMLDFGALSIDGTKIRAYASLYETKDMEGLEKSINILSQRMEKVVERSNNSDDEEEREEFDRRIQNIEKRQNVLNDFKEILKDRDGERVNRVDEDAKLMKESDGKSIIGYNAQAAIECGDNGIIVAAEVSQNPTDESLLDEMVDKAEENSGGEFDNILADASYVTYENMESSENNGRKLLGPDRLHEADIHGKNQKGEYAKSKFTYDNENDCYICPAKKTLYFDKMIETKQSKLVFLYKNKEACLKCIHRKKCLSKKAKYRIIYRDYREQLRERIRDRLDSNEGYLLYGKRSQTVEPVFGNIKQNKGVKQFFYRGIQKVNMEWKMICTGLNLGKIIKFLQGKNWIEILNLAFEEM